MGRPKIGDKLFIYGRDLSRLEDFDEFEYNSVQGYLAVGGYDVWPQQTDILDAFLPGFIVNFERTLCLTPETPISTEGLVDVTERLSLKTPLLDGTRIWMRI